VPTRTLLISIVTNVALTLLKIAGGAFAGSTGLIADGFHSLTDVIAMTANYLGMKASLKPANGLEAYDNYKREILGTFAVSFALFIIGLFILVRSYCSLTAGIAHSPGLGAALIVVVAFAVTCWLYFYSRAGSAKSDSPGLAINTEQIKLNVLSTVAVLIGIVGSCFDMNYLDAVAAIVVSLIILYSSVHLIRVFLKETEQARLSKMQLDEIRTLVAETEGTLRLARIKTMVIRKKVWLLLELVDSPEAPLHRDLIQRLKCNLLAKLLYLDNVIVGAARLGAGKVMKIEIEDFGRELSAAKNCLSLALVVALVLTISASAFGVSLFSQEYHVLIPADALDVHSGVSPRLGRAPYFYVYRIDKERGHFIENGLAAAAGDIDYLATKQLREYSVEAVITRNVGPYVFEELKGAGISLYQPAPNVSIAGQIDEFRKGKLNRFTKPNVDVKFGLRNFRLLKPWYNWQKR